MAKDRHLHHIKAFRTTTGVGKPRPSEGSDGDMTIRAIEKGLFLFVKYGNFWYHVSELETYNPKTVHPHKKKPISTFPGTVQGAGGGNGDVAIKSGSKIILNAINSRTGISGDNFIQSGSAATTESLGNLFDRDFLHFTVSGRRMLILDENSSGSRVLIGGNGANATALEAKNVYITNSYGAAPGYTKISTTHATEMILTAGDAANVMNIIIKENGGGANDYIAFPSLSKVFLDGGNNTYIQESSADHISLVAGGVSTLVVDNASATVTGNINGGLPHIINTGFNYSYTAGTLVYMPLSGYILENSSLTGRNEFQAFIAPYDGYLEKVIIRSENFGGSTIVGLHKESDGTELPSGTASNAVTVNCAAGNTSYSFAFGASASFDAGDILAISYDPYRDTNDTNATIVFRFDTTTSI